MGWRSLDAVGTVGGVVVLWDKRVVGQFVMSILICNVADGFKWVFCGV